MALLLFASAVNATLDQLSRAPVQTTLTWYSQKGDTLLACNGDLTWRPGVNRPRPGAPLFLHRT